MRLFILPISTRRALLYAQRVGPAAVARPTPFSRPFDWATTKANETWSSWERADGGWKKTVVGWGDALFARIPYPEWGLKSVPRREPGVVREQAPERAKQARVPAVFPAGPLDAPPAMGTVRELAQRGGFHRKWMWWSLAGMPFTAPIMLIPIIPNLPFFYLAFRAWSHWKATLGSQHLDYLVQNKFLDKRPSVTLQKIYGASTLSKGGLQELRSWVNRKMDDTDREALVLRAIKPANGQALSRKMDGGQPSEQLLAGEQTGQLISLCYNLPQIEAEMERARTQVQKLMAREAASATKDEGRKDAKAGDEKSPR